MAIAHIPPISRRGQHGKWENALLALNGQEEDTMVVVVVVREIP